MGLPAWDRVLLCSVLATNPNHKNQTCILLHACMHDIVFATCPVLGTLAAQINVIHEDKILQAPPWSQWRRKRRKWKRMRSHWPAATDLTLKGPQIEAAFEPHMKAIDAMGLLRPPLPKAPGSFRSKRERERLVRKKIRKKSRKNRSKYCQ